jgi:hypothetical protein
MNATLILAKLTYLKRHPEAWDAKIPHGGPVFHTPITEYVVATLVREISLNLSNRDFAAKLNQTAKALVDESSKMLRSGFETSAEVDDLCRPYLHIPIPPPPPPPLGGPSPDPWQMLGAQPDPWLETAPVAIREIALAVALRELANITTLENVSSALKAIGESVMKEASSRAFDEYCATPVKPRVPVPRPRATAA